MAPSQPLRTTRIFLYQFLTLGIYFLVWCHRLGNELSTALKRKAVPSMWWFVIPGGVYYWMWRMAESLDTATAGRIKQSDTFLLYVVLTGAAFGGGYIWSFPNNSNQSSNTQHVNWHVVYLVLTIAVVLVAVVGITLHAVFMSIIQKRLNRVRAQ